MHATRVLRAILILPGMVTVVIPSLIVWQTGVDTHHLGESLPVLRRGLILFGAISMATGLALMTATIRLFATVGRGTLAPWDPPQHLVVTGVYRYVRNPMISGVGFVLLGEAACTASQPLALWFLAFATIAVLTIPTVEEPGLAQRFGDEYRRYCRHVPRWIPRLSPWQGAE